MMTVSIFQRYILNPSPMLDLIQNEEELLPDFIPVKDLESLFSLYESASNEPPTTYRSDLNIRIVSGLTIASNLLENELKTEIMGIAEDRVLQHLEIPNTDYWAIELLENLVNKGKNGVSLKDLLSDQSPKQSSNMINGIHFLESKGFLERVHQQEN